MIFWGKSCFEVFGPEETKNGLKWEELSKKPLQAVNEFGDVYLFISLNKSEHRGG